MVEEPGNLILQYLRRFDARLARLEDDMLDVKMRLSSIESQIVGLHNEMAHVRGDVVHVLHRLDRTDERLLRIERRLDLVEAD